MAVQFGGTSIEDMRFDRRSMINDILRNIWVALLVALSAVLFAYVGIKCNYQPQYTSSTTFIVTTRGSAANVYSNLSKATSLANSFSSLLSSSVLQHKVAKDMGLEVFPATVKVNCVENTNLVELSVTADSPETAFESIRTIMNDYQTVSDYTMAGVILDVLAPPEVPEKPSTSMNLRSVLTKVGLGTMALMIALIGFLSYMKDTVKNEEDVRRKLDTRYLGTIFFENKVKSFHMLLHKTQISMLITSPLISFRYTEAFHSLAMRVRSRMESKQAKVLVVTSIFENEGKSTVAANLALALAQEGKRTLLMDCDLRKPAQHKIFELETENLENFGNVLTGKEFSEDYLVKTGENALDLLVMLKEYENSTEIISAGRLERIIEELKEKYDYIIIDTSPVAMTADAEELTQIVDAVALVVKQDFVLARDINDAIDDLGNGKAVVIGCVFNYVKEDIIGRVAKSGEHRRYGDNDDGHRRQHKTAAS